ncbi:MAG TPA: glutaredoxin family protein [Steroidobacter sp.]|jgi:thioredoxin reductase (NADPH)|nr:glutaredoxin family protein [Steroidobacter sp.]
MPQWTVYSRPQCSLCEELLADLAQVLPPAQAEQVRVIDVSQDPALERKYGLRIPVLTADGAFVCAYRLDIERVQAILGS